MSSFDSIVIGGGLVGSAVAYGLARRGLKVALLDEGDVAFRASRGNFGLVWVQSKGLGVPEYQRWTRQSSVLWDDLSVELRQETGIDTQHEHRGGIHVCITEKDFADRKKYMEQLHLESGETKFEYDMLDHAELKKLMPEIGPEIAGASYTPYDGAANPLYLLRSLHAALINWAESTGCGGDYTQNLPGQCLHPVGHWFEIPSLFRNGVLRRLLDGGVAVQAGAAFACAA